MNLGNQNEILELVFDSLSYVFLKDINGIYCGGNTNQAVAFGFKSSTDFVGKTIFEILTDYESAKTIDENDKRVMQSRQPMVIEEEIATDFGVKTYLSKKSPILNKNNEVIGLLGTAVDITELVLEREAGKKLEQQQQLLIMQILQTELNTQKNIADDHRRFEQYIDEMQKDIMRYQSILLKYKLNNDTRYVDNQPAEEIKLTKREAEILYFLSLNKSAKEIANIFSILEGKQISHSTVSSMINRQLYKKFGVVNTSELIEKATILRLIPFLPDSLINYSNKSPKSRKKSLEKRHS